MHFKSQADMPSNCPPSNAKAEHVEPVYRFIEEENVQAIDFLNHKEREKSYPPKIACEALAISFFTTITAAKTAGKKFKNLKNKKFVSGRITEDCGIHNTKNNHLNLWLYKDIDMLKEFLGEENKGES